MPLNRTFTFFRPVPFMVFSLLIIALLLSGCASGDKGGTEVQGVKRQTGDTKIMKTGMKVLQKTTFPHVDIRLDRRENVWVPLEKAAQSLDFKTQWDSESKTFAMGYTDPLFVVKMDETKAKAEDFEVILPDPPRLVNQEPYISIRSLSALWGTRVKWDATNRFVILRPIDDTHLSDNAEQMLREDKYGIPMSIRKRSQSSNLPDIDEKKLVAFARTFLGTGYRFGSKAYSEAKTFDSSSFVQNVFNRFGVALPRSSRAQARMGMHVHPDHLKPGDLLFFHVPGKFKTNRTVGHVAIYEGNGKMIHVFGDEGVTETPFHEWKDRFLMAKRITR